MKKAFVLLLACLMAVNVSAQKVKSSTSAKKATSSKSAAAKKSSAKKKSTRADGLLEKGTFYFNTNATNISFNNISVGLKQGSKTESLTRFGLQGTGGYALSEHLGLAAGVGFQYGKMEGNSVTAFTFNGGVRYYVIPNLYVSGMLVVGATSISGGMDLGDGGDDDDDDGGSVSASSKGHTFGADLGVGYSFFLTPRIAIEPNISYSIGFSNKMQNTEYKLNSLTFNIGFTIFI